MKTLKSILKTVITKILSVLPDEPKYLLQKALFYKKAGDFWYDKAKILQEDTNIKIDNEDNALNYYNMSINCTIQILQQNFYGINLPTYQAKVIYKRIKSYTIF